MKYELTEETLKRLCEEAVAKAIAESFGGYGGSQSRKKFEDLLAVAVTNSSTVIAGAVSAAIHSAVSSPQFQAAIFSAVVKSCSDKFAGTFDGVMKSAAKRAADDALLQVKVKEAVEKGLLK